VFYDWLELHTSALDLSWLWEKASIDEVVGQVAFGVVDDAGVGDELDRQSV